MECTVTFKDCIKAREGKVTYFNPIPIPQFLKLLFTGTVLFEKLVILVQDKVKCRPKVYFPGIQYKNPDR